MVRTRNAAWLTVLLLATLGALALSPLPFAGDIEARLGAALTPLTTSLTRAAQPVADVVLHAGQLTALTSENAALRDRVAQLEAEAATLRSGRDVEEQARALQASVGAEAGYLAAAVTVRDPAPGRRGLLIDRGAMHGVVAGQAVLGPGAALVGVVAEVQPHAARIRLIDDPHSAVAVALQPSKTPGVLAVGSEGLRLDFVPTGSTATVGDRVLTSALGGLPAGLLVGRVQAVEVHPEALFTSVRVEPYGDTNRLLRVLVVTNAQGANP